MTKITIHKVVSQELDGSGLVDFLTTEIQRKIQQLTKLAKDAADLKREEFAKDITVAKINNDGLAVRELNKQASTERIKIADIEKDLLANENKKAETSK